MRLSMLAMFVVLTGSVATAQWVDTTIALPDTTVIRDMALNEDNNLLFCTDAGWQALQIVNPDQRTFVDTVLGHQQPEEIIWNPVNGKLYVANAGGTGSVKICDGTTGQILSSIAVGAGATALAYNQTNNKLYCANQQDGTVSVIDCGADSVLSTVSVGPFPWDLSWNEAVNKVYCTVEDGATVAVIGGESNQLEGAVETGPYPWNIVSNDNANQMYYSVFGGNSVEVLDCSTGQVVATVPVGSGPKGIAWQSCTPYMVYVSCYNGRWVDAIDTRLHQVIKHISAGAGVDNLFYEPGNNKVYCALTLTDSVLVIDCATNEAAVRLPVGFQPTRMVRYIGAGDTVLVFIACGNKTIAVLADSPIGIAEGPRRLLADAVSVTPSPARHEVTVRLEPGLAARATVQVIDALGRVRLEQAVEPNRHSVSVGLTGLEPGAYLVRVAGVGVSGRRFVVTR